MRELLRRCRYILRYRRMSDDLAEEIAFHRVMKEEALQTDGLPPAEARQAAGRAMGNDVAAREQSVDAWVSPRLQDLAQDMRFAVRLVAKDPRFALVVMVALGLGIGVNNTLFSILNAYCIRGLPIDRPERVVYVGSRDAAGRDHGVSYRDFEDLRASATTVRELAAFAPAPIALRDGERAAERFQAVYTSAATFRLVGEAPVLGRDFRENDDRAGAPLVAIIGGGVWHGRFRADSNVVGRSIVIDGTPATIVGVMREGFGFPGNADVWMPLAAMHDLVTQPRDVRTLGVIGRLAEGRSLDEAKAELDAMSRRLAVEYRATNTAVRLTGMPINERFMGRLTDPAWLAFITAGALVVIIACANVANLLLSRAVLRAREIAIRASLGASRARVVRQLLVESTLLAAGAGVLGAASSVLGLRLLTRAIPAAAQPYWLDFSMDRLVFAVLASVCVATVFLSGLVPAIHISRTDVAAAMRDGGRGAMGGANARRWTAAFLTVEYALTMVLLSAVGETVVGFFEQRRLDRVVDSAPLLTMMVSLPPGRYPTAAQRIAFHDEFGARLREAGPVAGAAIAAALPASGAASRELEIEGRPSPDARTTVSVGAVIIDGNYFQTVRVPLIGGRTFGRRDGDPGHETAIVNQRLAEMLFAGGNAIGRRIRLASGALPQPGRWLEIVGVSSNIRQRPRLDVDPIVYLPYRADPAATMAVIMRANGDPLSIAPLVRQELQRLDRDLPAYHVLTMEQAIAEAGWNGRVSAWIITVLAAICVVLSVVGLYAVTSHSVAQRTPELGVRLALGARPREIQWLVLRRAIRHLVLGISVGLGGTYAWGQVFGSAGFGTPIGLAAVSLLLSATALLACLGPAARASRLDPVAALRAD